MIRLALVLALLAFPAFAQVIQINVPVTITGGPTDIGNIQITRNATYRGGTPGYVNGTMRLTDVISSGVAAEEWTMTAIVNNYSPLASGVALYGQANNYSTNEALAGVLEGNAYVTGGTGVALETDIRAVAGAVSVGVDCENFGGGGDVTCFRVPEYVPAIRDANTPGSYIAFVGSGHIAFIVNNVLAAYW